MLFGWAALMRVDAAPKRIVTLSSALTETVFALGFGHAVVATDVTSLSPEAAARLPRVSVNRAVSAEGIMAFRPDLVLAPEGDVPPAVVQHLRTAGIAFVPLRQQYTAKGALTFIRQVARALGEPAAGERAAAAMNERLQQALQVVAASAWSKPPTVLFIYARGTGALSVAGKGSSIDAIISLAGGRNAVQEFADFKPYSTEALVKANPDIIMMFDFGVSNLGGEKAIYQLPGVRITRAGKARRIIQVDGPLMVNFSTRLPEAIQVLNGLIRQKMTGT